MQPKILSIYFKELREVLRDRKTLIFMIVLPMAIMPIFGELATKFLSDAQKKAKSEKITYAIFNPQVQSELAQRFEARDDFEKVDIGSQENIAQAIADQDIKLGIVFPEDGASHFEKGYQLNVQVFYNNAELTTRVHRRAGHLIETYSDEIREERLAELGVSGLTKRKGVLEPVAVDLKGTANAREVLGSRMGGMLPYLFIIFCFVGALYPAIDLAAGEKERGTLETLLLTPVPRLHLVLGKFLVIFTTSVTSAVLCVLGMTIWISTKGQQVGGNLGEVVKSIGFLDLFFIALMLVPLAATFAAGLLSISIYARSYKEGQAYATPLNIFSLTPAIISMMPGVTLEGIWAWVPITNTSLAIKELVKGTMDYSMMFSILASTVLLAGGLIFFCTKWFQREDVLFRS